MYFQISLVKYFQISFSIFLKYLSSAFYDLPCEPLYTVSIGLQQFKCLHVSDVSDGMGVWKI